MTSESKLRLKLLACILGLMLAPVPPDVVVASNRGGSNAADPGRQRFSELAPRQWTEKSSGRQIEATLVESTDSSIVLRRNDGRRFEVPLSRLSEQDREYVAETCRSASVGVVRLWTDRSTGREIKATLVQRDGDSVVLERSDGRRGTVTIQSLCDDDQAFIRRMIASGGVPSPPASALSAEQIRQAPGSANSQALNTSRWSASLADWTEPPVLYAVSGVILACVFTAIANAVFARRFNRRSSRWLLWGILLPVFSTLVLVLANRWRGRSFTRRYSEDSHVDPSAPLQVRFVSRSDIVLSDGSPREATTSLADAYESGKRLIEKFEREGINAFSPEYLDLLEQHRQYEQRLMPIPKSLAQKLFSAVGVDSPNVLPADGVGGVLSEMRVTAKGSRKPGVIHYLNLSAGSQLPPQAMLVEYYADDGMSKAVLACKCGGSFYTRIDIAFDRNSKVARKNLELVQRIERLAKEQRRGAWMRCLKTCVKSAAVTLCALVITVAFTKLVATHYEQEFVQAQYVDVTTRLAPSADLVSLYLLIVVPLTTYGIIDSYLRRRWLYEDEFAGFGKFVGILAPFTVSALCLHVGATGISEIARSGTLFSDALSAWLASGGLVLPGLTQLPWIHQDAGITVVASLLAAAFLASLPKQALMKSLIFLVGCSLALLIFACWYNTFRPFISPSSAIDSVRQFPWRAWVLLFFVAPNLAYVASRLAHHWHDPIDRRRCGLYLFTLLISALAVAMFLPSIGASPVLDMQTITQHGFYWHMIFFAVFCGWLARLGLKQKIGRVTFGAADERKHRLRRETLSYAPIAMLAATLLGASLFALLHVLRIAASIPAALPILIYPTILYFSIESSYRLGKS